MERDFYTDEFEQLIKEKADQFRMYPSRRVWHSIYNNLHPSRRGPSFIIGLFFFSSLFVIGYLNTADDSLTRRVGYNSGSAKSTSSISNQALAATSPNAASSADVKERSQEIDAITDPNIPVNESLNIAGDKNSASGRINSRNGQADNNKIREENPGQKELRSASSQSRKAKIVADNPEKDDDLVVSSDSHNAKKQTSAKAEKQDIARPTRKKTAAEPVDTEPEEITAVPQPAAPSTTASTAKITDTESKEELPTDEKPEAKEQPAVLKNLSDKNVLDEKSWVEHFAMYNKRVAKKWTSKLEYEFYITPAVNYRKLTTESKGSVAPFATTGDINKAISQRPGLGIESGIGLSYAFAKNLRLKAGLQFNYTNYNINADQIGHPIQTTILMTDPVTGYSYPAARASSIANVYDQNALQPVTLHNRTYQVSIPVGLAYKLSSNKNVEWFVGASAQPSYIFGGKAHLISSDLKNYVSDPSAIRVWNLNIGLETFMNYKFGSYSLRVGPQVRYQVYSTYRKDVALIEKPYAVGLKIGLVKGF